MVLYSLSRTSFFQILLGRRSVNFLSVALVGLCFALSGPSDAKAQLTIENLIGSSVSEIGPQHKDVQEAINRFGKGDAQSARGLLEMAKKNNPELAPVEVLMAKMYYLSNNPRAGRQYLELAVGMHPNDPEAYILFATQAMQEGRLTDAEFLFAKGHDVGHSFKENPKRKRGFDIAAHGGMATIAEQRKAWAAAKQQLEGLLELDPENIKATQRLAVVLFKMGDASGAHKMFEKAASLDKKAEQLPADIYMGQLYAQEGNNPEATKFFGNAIKTAGDNANARVAIARWLLDSGEDRRAVAQFDTALKRDPNLLSALVFRGALARVEKDTATAEKNLSKAHLLAPGSAEPINQLALLLLTKEEPEEKQRGMMYAAVGNQMFPKSAPAKITYAWALLQTGRQSDALRALSEASKMSGISGDSKYYFARCLADLNQTKNAISALESLADQKGIFLHRNDAKALLAQLKGGTGN